MAKRSTCPRRGKARPFRPLGWCRSAWRRRAPAGSGCGATWSTWNSTSPAAIGCRAFSRSRIPAAGAQYTGEVGIPAIAVNPKPRITDAASLYSLGVAYSIAPRQVEAFLADAWPVISTLLTDHGPWEGFNVKEQKRIEFQTTAPHAVAAARAVAHRAGQHARYVESRKLSMIAWPALFAPCGPAELLKADTPVYAWADDPKAIRSRRTADGFVVSTDRVKRVGVAVVPNGEAGVDLSGGLLTVRYRASQALGPLSITLKPVGSDPAAPLIAKEIFTRFEPTDGGQRELTFLLPANPGLKRIKEIVFSCEPPDGLAGVEFLVKWASRGTVRRQEIIRRRVARPRASGDGRDCRFTTPLAPLWDVPPESRQLTNVKLAGMANAGNSFNFAVRPADMPPYEDPPGLFRARSSTGRSCMPCS